MAKKRGILWIILLVGVILLLPATYQNVRHRLAEQETQALIGSYDYDRVFNDPETNRRLTDFLGRELLDLFRSNLETIVPIERQDGFIVLEGLRAHSGGEEEAVLWIERPPAGERIIGLLMHNRYIRVYLPEGMTEEQLPQAFVDTLNRMNYNNYTVEYLPGDRRREDNPMPDDHHH